MLKNLPPTAPPASKSSKCGHYLCGFCGPVGPESTSLKVEPFHPSSWPGGDVGPVVPESLRPPVSRPAFMEDKASQPPSHVPVVKVGPPLRSSLKCPPKKTPLPSIPQDSAEPGNDQAVTFTVKKSIKWRDDHGKRLVEVKEFMPSESEDSDVDKDDFSSCGCAIQ